MFERQVKISNKLGLHARAAIKLVQLAQQFDAKITLKQAEQSARADSVLALLMLGSSQGKSIRVLTEGRQAEQALAAVCHLISAGFEEEE